MKTCKHNRKKEDILKNFKYLYTVLCLGGDSTPFSNCTMISLQRNIPTFLLYVKQNKNHLEQFKKKHSQRYCNSSFYTYLSHVKKVLWCLTSLNNLCFLVDKL